jgi:hypothetical protein
LGRLGSELGVLVTNLVLVLESHLELTSSLSTKQRTVFALKSVTVWTTLVPHFLLRK